MKAQQEYKTEIQNLITTWQGKLNRAKIDKSELSELSGVPLAIINLFLNPIADVRMSIIDSVSYDQFVQGQIDLVEQAFDRLGV